ncbi:MAG TPA: CotO family spore coat protein [Bacillus sp. (in: firmicutes)]|nr:CotO family spore coat protein [Bacillus sp. (in: firmicutes)]
MKNGKTKTEANAPLMYIVQPKIKQTKNSMQYYFSSSSQENQQEEEAKEESKQLELKDEPTFSLISPLKQEESKREEVKSGHKMFQEMTIEEKASFLVQFPKHMPQPVCEVTTKEKTYRGTITGVSREELSFIIPPHKDPISIPLQAVTQISIIKI